MQNVNVSGWSWQPHDRRENRRRIMWRQLKLYSAVAELTEVLIHGRKTEAVFGKVLWPNALMATTSQKVLCANVLREKHVDDSSAQWAVTTHFRHCRMHACLDAGFVHQIGLEFRTPDLEAVVHHCAVCQFSVRHFPVRHCPVSQCPPLRLRPSISSPPVLQIQLSRFLSFRVIFV